MILVSINAAVASTGNAGVRLWRAVRLAMCARGHRVLGSGVCNKTRRTATGQRTKPFRSQRSLGVLCVGSVPAAREAGESGRLFIRHHTCFVALRSREPASGVGCCAAPRERLQKGHLSRLRRGPRPAGGAARASKAWSASARCVCLFFLDAAALAATPSPALTHSPRSLFRNPPPPRRA